MFGQNTTSRAAYSDSLLHATGRLQAPKSLEDSIIPALEKALRGKGLSSEMMRPVMVFNEGFEGDFKRDAQVSFCIGNFS